MPRITNVYDMLSTNTTQDSNSDYENSTESNVRQPLLDTVDETVSRHKLPTPAKISMMLIFLIQALNGLAYTIISSLIYVTSFSLLHWSSITSMSLSLVFFSTTFISSTIGGVLADVRFGCYKMTFAGCCTSMIGQVIMYITFIFVNEQNPNQELFFRTTYIISNLLISIGQGILNVTTLPLVVRHMMDNDIPPALSRSRQRLFFRCYMFFYAIGMMASSFFLSTHGWLLEKNADENKTNFFLSSSLPLWCSGVATFLLIIGKRFYAPETPDTIQRGRRKLLVFVRVLLIKLSASVSTARNSYPKQLFRLIWLQLLAFSILGPYLTIYFLKDLTYLNQIRDVIQANNITLPEIDKNMELFLPAAEMLTVIMLALLALCIIRFQHWHKVVLGLVLATASAACSLAMEIHLDKGRDVAHKTPILWLAPQYGLLGMADALFFTGGYELSFAVSEKGLETFTLGLFHGLGSVFGLFLYIAFALSGTESYYPLLIVIVSITALTVPLFAFVVRRCVLTRKTLPQDPEEIHQRNTACPTSDTDGEYYTGRIAIWDDF